MNAPSRRRSSEASAWSAKWPARSAPRGGPRSLRSRLLSALLLRRYCHSFSGSRLKIRAPAGPPWDQNAGSTGRGKSAKPRTRGPRVKVWRVFLNRRSRVRVTPGHLKNPARSVVVLPLSAASSSARKISAAPPTPKTAACWSVQPSREAGAGQAFCSLIRAAEEAENRETTAIAQWSLGNLLRNQPGREQEPERAFREARDRGMFMAQWRLDLQFERASGESPELRRSRIGQPLRAGPDRFQLPQGTDCASVCPRRWRASSAGTTAMG